MVCLQAGMRHGADVRDPLVKCRTRRVRVAHRKLRLQLTRQPWFCLPNFNSKGHLPVSICLFRRPPPHPVRIADLNTTPSKSFSITRCFFFWLFIYPSLRFLLPSLSRALFVCLSSLGAGCCPSLTNQASIALPSPIAFHSCNPYRWSWAGTTSQPARLALPSFNADLHLAFLSNQQPTGRRGNEAATSRYRPHSLCPRTFFRLPTSTRDQPEYNHGELPET